MVQSQLPYSSLILSSVFISLIYRASEVNKKFKQRDVDASVLTTFNVGLQ